MGLVRDHSDTIVAIASPPGKGQRGIVRISGPSTLACLRDLFRGDQQKLAWDNLSSPVCVSGELCSEGNRFPGQLLLWPTSSSFTRQPSAEFHTIGARPILEMVVKAICGCGARPADPGEFTMRAFLSGRIDLTQAEAVLALIDATNQKQLETAIDQLAGGIGNELDRVRDELIAALAELEAGLDFVEEDIEFISNEAMLKQLRAALASLGRVLSQLSSRDRKSDTFRVALFGLPNAGKSSLFNRLIDRDAAIVSSTQGTTTDRVIETRFFGDQQVTLTDTAGLESINESDSSIKAASQRHRVEEIERCDLALLCISAATPANEISRQLDQVDASTNALVVLTQVDLVSEQQLAVVRERVGEKTARLAVTSSVTLSGVADLIASIERIAFESQSGESSIVGSTMLRTGQSLNEASVSIESAINAAEMGIGEEVVASEVRAALDAIGLIVGTIYTDDILDVVFGQFCIGK